MKELSKPTLFVTGSEGLVGSHLKRSYVDRADIKGIDPRDPEQPLDLFQERIILKYIDETTRALPRKLEAPLLIHLAAIVNGSGNLTSEQTQQMRQLNVEGTQAIVYLAEKKGMPIIHFSTDYVFRASRSPQPHQPTDLIQPDLTVYSQTKAKAEQIVLDASKKVDAVIVRIGFPYGGEDHPKPDFLRKVLGFVNHGIPLYADQNTSPSPLKSIAEGCWRAVQMVSQGKIPSGTILHLSGEPITPYQFANQAALIYGQETQVKAGSINGGPSNLVLDHTQTEELLGINIPSHQSELTRLRNLGIVRYN